MFVSYGVWLLMLLDHLLFLFVVWLLVVIGMLVCLILAWLADWILLIYCGFICISFGIGWFMFTLCLF